MPNRGSLAAFIAALVFSSCALSHHGPEITAEGTRFSLYAPEAKTVALAGSFNRWNPVPMEPYGPDRPGFWHITLPLPEKRHEYLFLIDGKTWNTDPGALSVSDGLGGKNSVVEITNNP